MPEHVNEHARIHVGSHAGLGLNLLGPSGVTQQTVEFHLEAIDDCPHCGEPTAIVWVETQEAMTDA